MAHDDTREVSPSDSKRPTFWRRERKQYLVLSSFRCGAKRAAMLLDWWVRDWVSHLLYVETLPFHRGSSARNYRPYHQKRGHLLKQCVVFRRLSRRSSKLAKFYSQKRGLPTFTNFQSRASRSMKRSRKVGMSLSHRCRVGDARGRVERGKIIYFIIKIIDSIWFSFKLIYQFCHI